MAAHAFDHTAAAARVTGQAGVGGGVDDLGPHSFGSGVTGPNPCMPPMSWMPFIVRILLPQTAPRYLALRVPNQPVFLTVGETTVRTCPRTSAARPRAQPA